MFRNIFLAVCFMLLGVTAVQAEGNVPVLKITSPENGAVLVPGQQLQVKMEIVGDSAKNYLDHVVSLDDMGLFESWQLIAADPYVFQGVVREDVWSARYRLVGSLESAAGQRFFSNSVLVSTAAPHANAYQFRHKSVLVNFPGDVAENMVLGVGADKRTFDLPLDIAQTVQYSVADETIAKFLPTKGVVGVKAGETTLTAKIDGHEMVSDIVVRGSGIRGDISGDRVINSVDMLFIQAEVGQKATVPEDARDLNHDGKIDEADIKILTTLCTTPKCATE